MPTYDLTCKACGNRFELFVPRMLRDEDQVCPVCGSTEVRAGVGGGVLGFRSASERAANNSSSATCGPGCGAASFG